MENSSITVKSLVGNFTRELADIYPPAESRQILYILFDEFMGWTKTTVHLSYDREIGGTDLRQFTDALAALRSGEPVQYILGKAWFNGMELRVNSAVLVPRPETEELCELVGIRAGRDQDRMLSLLDIGTGSGCIAIYLKKRFPGASVTGIDLSQAALDVASVNAHEQGCFIRFTRADILSREDQKELGMFDLIVSNPPYVTESERAAMKPTVTEFEPAGALFVPDEDPLLFYRTITGFAATHLNRPGRIFFEINEKFGTDVLELLGSAGFTETEIASDIHGKERFAAAILR
jgi:release factor glutamine methyltransferase